MGGSLLAAAALIVGSCQAQEADQPEPFCTVSGVVLDPDGEPVRDLEVGFHWLTYDSGERGRRLLEHGGGPRTTGPDGSFELAQVMPGFVRLYATIPGMLRASVDVGTLGQGQALADFELRSPGYGGSIIGTVVDEEGLPVEGAIVNYGTYADESDVVGALAKAEEGRCSTRTDTDGWFGIDTVPPGTDELSVYCGGSPRLNVPKIEVAEGGEVGLDLVLRRCLPGTWTLLGAVTDDEGLPVTGADVQIVYRAPDGEDGRERQHTDRLTTGDVGEFVLYGMPARTPVWVRAYDPERGMSEATFTGEADSYKEQTIALKPAAVLVGTVLGPDRQPAPGAELRVNLRRREESHPVTLPEVNLLTDEDGRYRLAGLPPGEWTLRVVREDWRAYHSEPLIVSATDREVRHDVVFPAGGTLGGTVVGPDGDPVRGARVVAYSEELRVHPNAARERSDGVFRFHALEPGTHSVVVTAPGFWPATVPVEFVEGQDVTDMTVRLGEGPSLSGVVTDEDGQPVPNIPVLHYRRASGAAVSTTPAFSWHNELARTDEDGAFTIRGVQVGEVGLFAVDLPAPGVPRYPTTPEPAGSEEAAVRPIAVPYRLADGTYAEAGGVLVSVRDRQDVSSADIHLAKFVPDDHLCTLRGRVVDPANRLPADGPLQIAVSQNPLGPGRVVQEKRPIAAGPDMGTADDNGRFEIRNVAPGEYYVIAGTGSTFLHVGHVKVAAGQEAALGDLPIPAAGALQGHVTDENGEAIAEGWAVAARTPQEARTLWHDETNPRSRRAGIGADGSYRFDRLDPGFWFVMTAGDQLPGSEIRRVFIDGTAEPLDFHHSYAGSIAGRITDPAGNPVPRASIRCEGDRYSSTPAARSGPDGRYELTGLPPGPYELRVAHPNFLPRSPWAVELSDERASVLADFALRPGGVVAGRVVRADGSAVTNGSRVFALELCRDGQAVQPLLLRDDGTFRSRAVEDGTYAVRVKRRDGGGEGASESDPVSVSAGQAAENLLVELPGQRE